MKTQPFRLVSSHRLLTRLAPLLVATLALLPAAAQAQAIQAWVQRYGGPGNGDDRAYGLVVDTSGNVYVTGDTIFGPTDNDRPWATIKYSNSGVPLWTNFYGSYAYSFALALDATGNVFVTGYGNNNGQVTIKYSSAGVGLWTNLYSLADSGVSIAVDASENVVVSGQAGSRCTTVKYSGAGAQLWARGYSLAFGGSLLTEMKANMAMDASSNVVVTGDQDDSSGSGFDYVTVKYSDAGVPLWTNRYNGPGNSRDYRARVAVDASGNVFVTGWSVTTNGSDYATIKYSSAGVPLWTNRYDGPANQDDGATALAADASGNVVVTGWSYLGDYYDYLTVKYSSAGVPLWTNRYRGSATSSGEPRAVVVDARGNVIVTGSSGDDYVTIAYSSAGVPVWTNRYNGPANSSDDAYALTVDASGDVYVTGRSANNSTYPYGYDYATVKYIVPPIIARQPLSCSNAVGTTASFSVEAVGGLPLSYQWRRQETNLANGVTVSGVTTTNLLISNVQLADAGSYTVVITNTYGSVTSSVAQLTVYVPPNPGRFTKLSYSPETGFSFIFRDATVGKWYRIQTLPSLAEGSWADWLNFNYTGPMLLTDLGAVETTNKLYRAISP